MGLAYIIIFIKIRFLAMQNLQKICVFPQSHDQIDFYIYIKIYQI